MMRLPRWVLLVLLAISVLFTLAGIAMIATGSEGGWPGFLFFGCCSAVFVAQLWPSLLLSQPAEPLDALLQRFAGPVELHVPQRKTALVLVSAIVFAGVCIWFLRTETHGIFVATVMWICVAAALLSLPLLAYQMIRGSSLRLEDDGFRIKQPWRWHFIRWKDTSPFEVVSTTPFESHRGDWSTLVFFDDKAAEGSKLLSFNRRLAGRNSALPDSYGLSPEDLCTLMNKWRERALQTGAAIQPPR